MIPDSSEMGARQPVQDRKKLVKACQNAIREAIGNQNLGFQEHSERHGRCIYVLNSPFAGEAQDRYRHRVVPLAQSPHGWTWLGASIEFEFLRGLCYLSAVRLIVFEGTATDPRKAPMLRAEWEGIQPDSEISHAQPHWHAYPTRTIDEATRASGLEPSVREFASPHATAAATESLADELRELRDFHLAMASRWHIDGIGAHQLPVEADGLVKWLRGCLRYTREQIEYIYA